MLKSGLLNSYDGNQIGATLCTNLLTLFLAHVEETFHRKLTWPEITLILHPQPQFFLTFPNFYYI